VLNCIYELMEIRGYQSIYRFLFCRTEVPAGHVGFSYYRPVLATLIAFIAVSAVEVVVVDLIVRLGQHPDAAADPERMGLDLHARISLRNADPSPCNRSSRHPSSLWLRDRHPAQSARSLYADDSQAFMNEVRRARPG
jgi:hypothetical protein